MDAIVDAKVMPNEEGGRTVTIQVDGYPVAEIIVTGPDPLYPEAKVSLLAREVRVVKPRKHTPEFVEEVFPVSFSFTAARRMREEDV